MPKAAAKHTTPVLPIDPVVELSKKLLNVWDADSGADAEFLVATVGEQLKDEATDQLNEWRSALETIITYTEPVSFQGALVQLALGLTALNDMDRLIKAGDKDELNNQVLTAERLVYSALRAMMLSAPGQKIDEDVKSIVNIYVGDGNFFDQAEAWSEKARADRKSELNRSA